MKVYHDLAQINELSNTVVTVGSFDGVHYGHKKILKRLRYVAKKYQLQSVVLTFLPHPQIVLRPDDNFSLLSDVEEKISLISSLSIDHLLFIPFNSNFSQISAMDFVKNILIEKIHTKYLIIGHDHRFGKDKRGDAKYLEENRHIFKIQIEKISKKSIQGITINSDIIREALRKGEVEKASTFLERKYQIKGQVIRGKQIGKKLGFPTANIQLHEKYKLIPHNGIYAVSVQYNKKQYQGMMSIGNNPTISDKLVRTLEVNIFNFDKDIYEKEIIIHFERYIRPEKKFPDLTTLKNHINQDKKVISSFFRQRYSFKE